MVDSCAYVHASRDVSVPALVGPKQPGEIIPLFGDYTLEIDCEGQGITIATSDWTVNAEDDDGALTLTMPQISGLTTSVQINGGTAGTSYRVKNTVTTSDLARFEFDYQIPIRTVEKIPIAA